MLRIVLVLLFALPLAAAAGARGVGGTYDSNYDDVRLVQDGDRIHGTYVCCGGGKIEGRIIEGRIIRYRWEQPGSWGMGVWKIEGDRLTGTWGSQQDDDDGGAWNLVRETQIAR